MTERKSGDGRMSGDPAAPDQGDGEEDFARRLKKARVEAGLDEPEVAPPPYGVAAEALRRATELVVGVFVGAFIGWWVDKAFGTSPFGVIGFFLLGAATGMWNVVRSVGRYNAEHGIGTPPRGNPGKDDPETDG